MAGPRLKRCPFDGGKAEYRGNKTTYADRVSTHHEVTCATCAARMTIYETHYRDLDLKKYAAAKSALVKQWNTRKAK